MATHNETGKIGENLAINWVIKAGYAVLHTNWRFSHYEVDIIASKLNRIHFIEVKTRRQTAYGWPEESISISKLKTLMKAGAAFLELHPHWKEVQYDALSINLYRNKEPEFLLIEDLYWMEG